MRDCDRRCSADLHTVSPRIAERNRYVCHSALCCAGPRRSRGFSSSVAAARFTRSLPSQYCLVSLNRSNPSASTPSLKPLPPARLSRPKCVAVHPDSTFRARAGKYRHLSPRPSYRPAPAAPVGLPAHSPEDRKNDADAPSFPTSYESSGEYAHA